MCRVAVSWIAGLGPGLVTEGDRHLYIWGTARLKSPVAQAPDGLGIEYRESGALGDGNGLHPSSAHVDMADEKALAFRSLAIWKGGILWGWRMDRQAFCFGLRKR